MSALGTWLSVAASPSYFVPSWGKQRAERDGREDWWDGKDNRTDFRAADVSYYHTRTRKSRRVVSGLGLLPLQPPNCW